MCIRDRHDIPYTTGKKNALIMIANYNVNCTLKQVMGVHSIRDNEVEIG